MKLSVHPMTLELKRTFRVSPGASDRRHNILVVIEHDGVTGYGEAAAVPYYGDTQESLSAYLAALPPLGEDPFALEEILNTLPEGSHAARAAVDIALHDLWGKLIGQPLYKLFGLKPTPLPQTSFTISIDSPEVMAARVKEANYPILKIKVGAEDVEESIAAIRRVSDAKLRVDANGAWKPQQALELIGKLSKYDLELVEQPLPLGDVESFRWLRENLKQRGINTPIYADESVKTSRDVAKYAGALDGVVVKLMKTGGLREALRTIHTARAHGMRIMLSCMVESSLAVTAAAHLAPLCDQLDLDGPLLIKNDPFVGLKYTGANLSLPDNAGLGVCKVQP